MKHTPRPLEVYEGPKDKPELTVQHVDKGGQVVTVADCLQQEIPPKERKANAVLFAAAPDYKEAADALAEFVEGIMSQLGGIACDIGALNEGLLAHSRATAKTKGKV